MSFLAMSARRCLPRRVHGCRAKSAASMLLKCAEAEWLLVGMVASLKTNLTIIISEYCVDRVALPGLMRKRAEVFLCGRLLFVSPQGRCCMRGIPVLFNNNHTAAVSGLELDRLLENGSLRAFRRMSGWVIVGQDPVRGKGGSYGGQERRRQLKRQCSKNASGRVPDGNSLWLRSCLTCANLVNGKCQSKVSSG